MAAHPGRRDRVTPARSSRRSSEHYAIFNGIVLSSIVTALLVALVLALYFRSATLLVLLVGTIAVATAAAFGAAALTVGHLNAATAFLGAIIAGNGVNYGILLIARYLEERRRPTTSTSAMAAAIVGTLRPTAVASLGAAIAYGSLAATSFKGFADFAVIGAIGMLLCWIASYVLLPALMLAVGGKPRTYHGEPFVGRVLGQAVRVPRLARRASWSRGAARGRRRGRRRALHRRRSVRVRHQAAALGGPDAVESRHWMKVSDDNFGRGYRGPDVHRRRPARQVPLIVDALLATTRTRRRSAVVGSVDVDPRRACPPIRPRSSRCSREIRTLLDDDGSRRARRQGARRARRAAPARRPRADHARRAAAGDQATSSRSPKDGRVGYMISIRSANGLDEWNGHDLIRFADAVRALHLRDGETVTTSGSSA